MMKLIVLVVLTIAATSAFAQTTDIGKVEWLVGKWTRTNAKPGRSGVEIWTKKSATELVGRGISLKGTDTTFVEKLRIVVKDNKLFYVSDVPENKGEVWFGFTVLTENGFVCEDPKHDFPKKISYTLSGGELTAVVSGDGKMIDFVFKRE